MVSLALNLCSCGWRSSLSSEKKQKQQQQHWEKPILIKFFVDRYPPDQPSSLQVSVRPKRLWLLRLVAAVDYFIFDSLTFTRWEGDRKLNLTFNFRLNSLLEARTDLRTYEYTEVFKLASLKSIVSLQCFLKHFYKCYSCTLGVEILLVASCYRNQDKLRPDEPLGSYEDLTYVFHRPSDQELYFNSFSGKAAGFQMQGKKFRFARLYQFAHLQPTLHWNPWCSIHMNGYVDRKWWLIIFCYSTALSKLQLFLNPIKWRSSGQWLWTRV